MTPQIFFRRNIALTLLFTDIPIKNRKKLTPYNLCCPERIFISFLSLSWLCQCELVLSDVQFAIRDLSDITHYVSTLAMTHNVNLLWLYLQDKIWFNSDFSIWIISLSQFNPVQASLNRCWATLSKCQRLCAHYRF